MDINIIIMKNINNMTKEFYDNLSEQEKLVFKELSERNKELYAMLESGYRVSDVAAHYGITNTRVHQLYRQIKRRIDRTVKSFNAEGDDIILLRLESRIYNALKRAGINTIDELRATIDNGKIYKVRNLGDKSTQKIFEAIRILDGKEIEENDKFDNYKLRVKYIQNFGADIQYQHHIRRWIKCYLVDKNFSTDKKVYIPFIVEITEKNNYHIYKEDGYTVPVPDEVIINKLKKLLQ